MPQMGVSVAEGTIVEWLKRPGDWVESDEIVCVVTTDKVDVEIPSPGAGRLERILVEPGETVAVGTPLAEIDDGATPGRGPPRGGDRRRERRHAEPAAETEAPDRSGFYSPVVRRIAEEHGVDLERVEGHGVGGRIRKSDLLGYIEGGGSRRARRAGGRCTASRPTCRTPSRTAAAAGARSRRAERRAPRADVADAPGDRPAHGREPPDLGALHDDHRGRPRRRRRRRAPAPGRRWRRGASALTYLAFVAEATVAALQRHPILNASIEGDEIVHHDDVNLGIAVALETGLIVPVIEQAQRLSLEGLAAAIEDLATRARVGRARARRGQRRHVHDHQPGPVRLGAGDADHQPAAGGDPRPRGGRQAARRRRRPGRSGDSIAIRPMTNLCMSWDHRALDGVEAARFLGEIKDSLEGWRAER